MFKQIVVVTFFLLSTVCDAERVNRISYPEVGDKCPNIVFSDLRNYKGKSVSIDDFKGKWLVLDCWNRYCSVCVSGLPRIDSLQRELKDSVQFMLVGYTGSQYMPWRGPDKTQIKNLYERIQKRQNLKAPIAFDSVLFKTFNIGGCPFVIVVSPEGIIKGLTTKLTRSDMDDFLAGRSPILSRVTRLDEELSR